MVGAAVNNPYSKERSRTRAIRLSGRCLSGAELQRLPAAATGGLAILVDHAAAVLGVPVGPVVAPLAAELLMDGQALRVAKVDVTAGADVRGHELIFLSGDRPVAVRLLGVASHDSYSGTPSSK
jgi:hypothetical protein